MQTHTLVLSDTFFFIEFSLFYDEMYRLAAHLVIELNLAYMLSFQISFLFLYEYC